ncbi:MAG: hypothetical protein ABIJ82_00135 [Patescibacteria group bacterium]|nr:hypothetical protein [Patescibacteria group bacterium]MBU1952911.1 hypothetical protein [Patescibacteria group bacterium]
MPRKTIILGLGYLSFIVVSFFYVKSILKTENLFPKDNVKPKIEKTWTISASLIVNTGSKTFNYKTDVKNTDSIMSFLEDLRNNKGLVFEKVDYTHGVEIDSLFNTKASDGYKWAVFQNGNDLTDALSSTRILDGAVYEIRLVKK